MVKEHAESDRERESRVSSAGQAGWHCSWMEQRWAGRLALQLDGAWLARRLADGERKGRGCEWISTRESRHLRACRGGGRRTYLPMPRTLRERSFEHRAVVCPEVTLENDWPRRSSRGASRPARAGVWGCRRRAWGVGRVSVAVRRLRWSSFCGAGRPSAKERAKSGWAWRLNTTRGSPWLSTEGAFDGGHGAHHGHF